MHDFRFANPKYLLLLILLAGIFLLVRRLRSHGREKLERFVAAENLRRLLVSTGAIRENGKRFALWAGLALMTIALARPQANPTIEEVEGASLDIYVLLDISRSMDTEDMAPSRLRKAKKSIQHLMDLLSGDRVGVIGFASSAALLVPLTSDYEIVRSVLQNIDSSIIPSQGTDLAGALELASSAMERGAQVVGANGEARTNIFLVLSDGEDHAAGKFDVVENIREQGGLIFTIAFGTEKGAPIPVRNENGELMGYKRDTKGNTVVSTVQTKALNEIAQRGGGQFYFSTLEEREIEDILARVQGAQRSGAVTTKAKVYEELFLPVVFAAILLFLYSFLSVRSLLRQVRMPRRAGLILMFALVPQLSHANPLSYFWNKERRVAEQSRELSKEGKPEAAAEQFKVLQAENPDSGAVTYNLGTYLLEAKKLEEGREQLSRISQAKNFFQAEALYNLAGSYLVEQKRPEAIAGFAELIRRLEKKNPLVPKEQEILAKARQNLALLSQEEQKNPQPQRGSNQEKQGGQGEEGKDKKEDQKKDGSGKSGEDQKKEDQKKDGQKDGEQKNDEQKDEQKKNEEKSPQNDKQPQDGPNQPPPPPRRGSAPFRERDNMSESDAKKILESLKQQEGSLQKKFLKKNNKNSKVNDDANGQDW